MSTLTKQNHIGRKISRIRELKDMKQEALAQALGISQQAISILENSETVDEVKLEEIAKALGVSVDGIRNFSEDVVLNIISNTVNNHDNTSSSSFNYCCTFNPLDEFLKSVEENKKLYERLLKAEQDKIEYLEKLLNK